MNQHQNTSLAAFVFRVTLVLIFVSAISLAPHNLTGQTPTPSCDDDWTATSMTDAASPRTGHTAVWTGKEMIVWGGQGWGLGGNTVYENTGWKYNPGMNSWTSISTTNAPSGRTNHTAVWTGSEMIVWGGHDENFDYVNTGARYNPSTDSWTPMTTTAAPTGRESHIAVWTGSEMIVWGGTNDTTFMTNTGGRYNPATDTWTATSVVNAPVARVVQSAIWTGGEMIVWGGKRNTGDFLDTGGRYDPITDSWAATNTSNAPAARGYHNAVWTGGEMLVWGGANSGSNFNSGGRYSPPADSWTPMTTTDAPIARGFPSTVWTGHAMIVWGGTVSDVPGRPGSIHPDLRNYLNSGGRYCAEAPAPTPSPTPAPTPTPTPTATPSATPSGAYFEVNAPSLAFQGVFFDITVTAKIFDKVFTNYTGTVHFTSTSTDFGTQLPADSTLTNGVGTFSVTLGSNGNQTITATDTVNASMTGTSGNIVVLFKSGPTPSPTPTPPSPTPTPTPSPVAQALNLSTRMKVQTGDNVGIGGFIITGTAPKHVLLRAIGPSLSPGVLNPLADPVMELHGPNGFVTVSNDNWRDDPAQEALIIASGIPPTNNLEAAIDVTLSSGAYTVIVSGRNNTSGIGLVEAYDLSQAVDSKLSNISTRAFVETGDDVVIAGFILGGNTGSDRIVVRGIGPSLAGVTEPLADPTLELRDGDGVLLASNNDWQDDPAQAAELTAAGLAPTNDLEAAIATTLPPGPFTVLLAGANSDIGVGLVEVYDRGAP